ncbi:hypothetical protein [Lapidilactobacillus wuchangensis]|uniref:hypothetical protein n=1 Tax=Lapidilactobacillus wuchangensis TaxID=2486001 RepID=UPI000F7B32FB|nr:hypothetical protein [Lapidilactobacillus wuchangensis]
MPGDLEGMERCGRRFEVELVLGKIADNSVAAGGLWNAADADLRLSQKGSNTGLLLNGYRHQEELGG